MTRTAAPTDLPRATEPTSPHAVAVRPLSVTTLRALVTKGRVIGKLVTKAREPPAR
ncbi:MAG: hypothetical protein FWD74_05395 [Actinomycetia bacterium]|nr:hypothetical protein [Actinomycetes bacterium]